MIRFPPCSLVLPRLGYKFQKEKGTLIFFHVSKCLRNLKELLTRECHLDLLAARVVHFTSGSLRNRPFISFQLLENNTLGLA